MADEPTDAPAAPASRHEVPYLALVAVAAILVPLRAALRPIEDIDVYWHLLVGRDILGGIPIAEAGRGWDFTSIPDTWVTTQWVAEVVFAQLEEWGGYTALIVFRVVSTVVALAVLAAVTVVRREPRASVWPFGIAALSLSMTTQVRSMMATYILAPLVGWWGDRLWRKGVLPRWWIVLPLVVVWANTHGGWVLLPMVLGLASLARLLDHGWRDPSWWRGILLAVGATLVSAISPAGLDTTLAAFRFASSTALISEWQPVDPWSFEALPLDLMAVVAVVCWARGRVRPTRGELLLVLGLVAFGFTAWRSVPVTCLLLAPVLVGVLARALGMPDPRPAGSPRPRLARVTIGAFAVGALLSIALGATQVPQVSPSLPVGLIARLHDAPSPQRVLNAYNVAGPLLWMGGPPPQVRVGIDGRADRWGPDYITDYADLMEARPGWQTLFDQLDPTSALLGEDQALRSTLVAERGWVEVAQEGTWVLLRAPDAAGGPS